MSSDTMPHHLSRRSLLTGAIALPLLAACNRVARSSDTSIRPDDAILTDAFDGRYEITVNRLRNGLESDGSTPDLKSLATLTTRVVRGEMTLASAADTAAGTNYTDFSGFFSVGGRLRMRFTAGYLTGKVAQSELTFDDIIGNTLQRGQTVTLQPSGFGENYTPVIMVRFLGA